MTYNCLTQQLQNHQQHHQQNFYQQQPQHQMNQTYLHQSTICTKPSFVQQQQRQSTSNTATMKCSSVDSQKDYSIPLHVDCSIEYDLPKLQKPPSGQRIEPILIIHPSYFRKIESQRRTPFVNNMPNLAENSRTTDSTARRSSTKTSTIPIAMQKSQKVMSSTSNTISGTNKQNANGIQKNAIYSEIVSAKSASNFNSCNLVQSRDIPSKHQQGNFNQCRYTNNSQKNSFPGIPITTSAAVFGMNKSATNSQQQQQNQQTLIYHNNRPLLGKVDVMLSAAAGNTGGYTTTGHHNSSTTIFNPNFGYSNTWEPECSPMSSFSSEYLTLMDTIQNLEAKKLLHKAFSNTVSDQSSKYINRQLQQYQQRSQRLHPYFMMASGGNGAAITATFPHHQFQTATATSFPQMQQMMSCCNV